MRFEKFRQKSWIEHFFGPGAPRASRVFRLAFRDFVVETSGRCEGMLLLSGIVRRWQRSARGQHWRRDYEARCMRTREAYEQFRIPTELRVTEVPIRRALVVGSCFAEAWVLNSAKGLCNFECDFVLLNNVASLSDHPPRPASSYDIQVVQISLASVLPDQSYFGLAYSDVAAHEKLFEDCKARLSQFLKAAMQWNLQCGLLTFVSNFLVPQQNPMGKLLPRYELRNPVHFVEQLNAGLARELEGYGNAYLLDIDQIASSFGRMFV